MKKRLLSALLAAVMSVSVFAFTACDPEEKLDEAKTKKLMKQIDKNRAIQHELFSDIKWGDKDGYHLCINTTNLDIKSIIPYLVNYINEWFEQHDKL